MSEATAPSGAPDSQPLLCLALSPDRAQLRSDEYALGHEWLVTNGIGGYAAASLAGANTRRYHGLLVAALQAPLGRAVLLAKLEETLEVRLQDGSSHSCALSANVYPGALAPQGHHSLLQWSSLPTPGWVWEPLPGVQIEKRVWMAGGANTTYVAYRLLTLPTGATARLSLVPLLAWRDYHSEMGACDTVLDAHWTGPEQASDVPDAARLTLTLPPIQRVTDQPTALALRLTTTAGGPYPSARFSARPDWYYRFQHPREADRGLDHAEDLYTPGAFAADLRAGETLTVVASTETAPPPAPEAALSALVQTQIARIEAMESGRPTDAFLQRLTLAADAFVVQTPERTTIIAGYPWFSDWGRDTMIALPGLCLSTGRPEIAAAILRSFTAHVDGGMIPNRFPDVGETPEYNTVDATLWFFVAIQRYLETTDDVALLRETLWPALQEIVRCHRQGTRYGIRVDPTDHLLYAGQPGTQLTWMDAKVGDWVVTPRVGKPVEINALWHNALRAMAQFAERLGAPERDAYAAAAQEVATSFNARYARLDGRGLYDVLDTPGGGPDLAIRPNQVFALSLPYAPIDPTGPLARAIILTVQQELYTPCGLRTLSPRDPEYRARYEGDPLNRDRAYHQGTVWPWLLGPYVEACFRVSGNRERAMALLTPLQHELSACGMGSLAEVYDGSIPHRPNGCPAQAWSIAETLRVWKLLLESDEPRRRSE